MPVAGGAGGADLLSALAQLLGGGNGNNANSAVSPINNANQQLGITNLAQVRVWGHVKEMSYKQILPLDLAFNIQFCLKITAQPFWQQKSTKFLLQLLATTNNNAATPIVAKAPPSTADSVNLGLQEMQNMIQEGQQVVWMERTPVLVEFPATTTSIPSKNVFVSQNVWLSDLVFSPTKFPQPVSKPQNDFFSFFIPIPQQTNKIISKCANQTMHTQQKKSNQIAISAQWLTWCVEQMFW
jgi:hypothetical protein